MGGGLQGWQGLSWRVNRHRLLGLAPCQDYMTDSCAAPASRLALPALVPSPDTPPCCPPGPQVDTLSLRHWDQDDPHEMFGAHCFVPGGRCGVALCTPPRCMRHARHAPRASQRAPVPSLLLLWRAPVGLPVCALYAPCPRLLFMACPTPALACAAGCNGRWVQELCRGLPIFYDNPVREVRYCSTGRYQPGSSPGILLAAWQSEACAPPT